MNTKIIYSIAVLAVAALAAVNVRVNTQDNDLSDVSLANVEALADETGGNYYQRHCGSQPGTQCQSTITGPSCPRLYSCP